MMKIRITASIITLSALALLVYFGGEFRNHNPVKFVERHAAENALKDGTEKGVLDGRRDLAGVVSGDQDKVISLLKHQDAMRLANEAKNKKGYGATELPAELQAVAAESKYLEVLQSPSGWSSLVMICNHSDGASWFFKANGVTHKDKLNVSINDEATVLFRNDDAGLFDIKVGSQLKGKRFVITYDGILSEVFNEDYDGSVINDMVSECK